MKKFIDNLKKFWKFLNNDSWSSLLVTLIIAFFVIKFILFPGLSLITGTSLPLVIVESCSMYHHGDGFEKTFESSVYEDYGIGLKDTESWDFQNGLNKGDVIFVVGAKNIGVGDIIIFNGETAHPIIHRTIRADETYSTKGDNYKTNGLQLSSEKNISEEQLVGKALFKIPLVGWVKLIFFEGSRASKDKGLCS